MNNKLYDVLKWLSLVALDAIGVAYEQLSGVWNLPCGAEVEKTCVIASVLIGTLIGVTSATYNKRIKNDIPEETEEAED